MADTPRVFISYSHDSDAHKERVRELSDWLRTNGVEAILDRYREHEASEWNIWAEREVAAARYVLVVCTETYHRRYLQQEDPGRGEGVIYESIVIRNAIGRGDRGRFLAVFFDLADRKHVPRALSTEYSVATTEARMALLHVLFEVPTCAQPPVGAPPVLTTRPAFNRDAGPQEPNGPARANDAAGGRSAEVDVRALAEDLVARWNATFGAAAVLRVLERLTPTAKSGDDAPARATMLLARDALATTQTVQQALIDDQQELGTPPVSGAARVAAIKENARVLRRVVLDLLPLLGGPSHRQSDGSTLARACTAGLAELPAAALVDRSAHFRYSAASGRMYAPAQVPSLPETGFDASGDDTIVDLIRHLNAVCGTNLSADAVGSSSQGAAGESSLIRLRGILGNRRDTRNPNRPRLYIAVEGDPLMAGAIAVPAAIADRIKQKIPELDLIAIHSGTPGQALYEAQLEAAASEVIRLCEEISA